MGLEPVIEVVFTNYQQLPVMVALTDAKCICAEHEGTRPSDLERVYGFPGDTQHVFLDPDASGPCSFADTIVRYQVTTAGETIAPVGEFSLTCTVGRWSCHVQTGDYSGLDLYQITSTDPSTPFFFVVQAG